MTLNTVSFACVDAQTTVYLFLNEAPPSGCFIAVPWHLHDRRCFPSLVWGGTSAQKKLRHAFQ